MLGLQSLACLLVAASALDIRGDAPADIVDEALSCKMVSNAAAGALSLASDVTLDNDDQYMETTDAEKRYEDALKEYRQKKSDYKIASGNVMAAIDTLLDVPSVDVRDLEAIVTGANDRKDTLVVFYAPWCPHCQTFVMHDAFGNPLGAPLEALRKDFLADVRTNHVDVVRADVVEIGLKNIPKAFKVVGFPTVYFVNKRGEAVEFVGNPHSTEMLAKFVVKSLAADETKKGATSSKTEISKTKKHDEAGATTETRKAADNKNSGTKKAEEATDTKNDTQATKYTATNTDTTQAKKDAETRRNASETKRAGKK